MSESDQNRRNPEHSPKRYDGILWLNKGVATLHDQTTRDLISSRVGFDPGQDNMYISPDYPHLGETIQGFFTRKVEDAVKEKGIPKAIVVTHLHGYFPPVLVDWNLNDHLQREEVLNVLKKEAERFGVPFAEIPNEEFFK